MNLFKYLKEKRELNNSNTEDINIKEICEAIKRADAIIIGAGAGLSTSAGLTYDGRRFKKNFADFIEKYGMEDMYSSGFYPFNTQEEKWAYWSKHIFYNRYDVGATKVYSDLYKIVKDKNYFVLTTNVDHQFWLADFEDKRIFATQGDYGLFQCAKGCHKKLYDNEAEVMAMVFEQKDCKIPTTLVPKCPICAGEMEVNIRCDEYFVEDEKWHQAYKRYSSFLEENKNKNLLFLELGVGMNTPGIIKYPFWQMTYKLKNSYYICINKGEAWSPDEIKDRSISLDRDIGEVVTLIGGKIK